MAQTAELANAVFQGKVLQSLTSLEDQTTHIEEDVKDLSDHVHKSELAMVQRMAVQETRTKVTTRISARIWGAIAGFVSAAILLGIKMLNGF